MSSLKTLLRSSHRSNYFINSFSNQLETTPHNHNTSHISLCYTTPKSISNIKNNIICVLNLTDNNRLISKIKYSKHFKTNLNPEKLYNLNSNVIHNYEKYNISGNLNNLFLSKRSYSTFNKFNSFSNLYYCDDSNNFVKKNTYLFKRLFSNISKKYLTPMYCIDNNERDAFKFVLLKLYSSSKGKKYSTPATDFIANDERVDFDSVLPELIKVLTAASKHNEDVEIKEWFSKVLRYNVSGGKNIRGLNVVYSYKLLSRDINKRNIKLSYILGWCVEMLQAFSLVIDDIQDESETRRGLPSWYRLEDVGSANAINDGLQIEAGIYKLLKIYFKDCDYYLDLIELFHDATLKSLLGQGLDIMTGKWGVKRDFSKFTEDRYFTISKYKTSYYTFHLPVALALYMSGIRSEEIHNQCKQILLEIGEFFQVQDDFLDCFGDIKLTGKIGNDIREGKCSWLAVNALKLSDKNQLTIFYDNYATADENKIARVKQLYIELGLVELYKKYEEESREKIIKNIHEVNGVPREIFTNSLNIINKRIN